MESGKQSTKGSRGGESSKGGDGLMENSLDTATLVYELQELTKALDLSSGPVDVQSLVQPLRKLLKVPEQPQPRPPTQGGSKSRAVRPEQTLANFVNGLTAISEDLPPPLRAIVEDNRMLKEEVRGYQRRLAAVERRIFLESAAVEKWKGKAAKLKDRLSSIPKGAKQLAAADEKLRAKVEAQAAALADLEQRHGVSAKLAAAFERQLRVSAASAQRELGRRDGEIEELKSQLEEREKELRHALLRVRVLERQEGVEPEASASQGFRAGGRSRTAGAGGRAGAPQRGAAGPDGRPLWVTDWRDGLPWEASSPAAVGAAGEAGGLVPRGGSASASGRQFFSRVRVQSPPGNALGFSPPGTARSGARRLPAWDQARDGLAPTTSRSHHHHAGGGGGSDHDPLAASLRVAAEASVAQELAAGEFAAGVVEAAEEAAAEEARAAALLAAAAEAEAGLRGECEEEAAAVAAAEEARDGALSEVCEGLKEQLRREGEARRLREMEEEEEAALAAVREAAERREQEAAQQQAAAREAAAQAAALRGGGARGGAAGARAHARAAAGIDHLRFAPSTEGGDAGGGGGGARPRAPPFSSSTGPLAGLAGSPVAASSTMVRPRSAARLRMSSSGYDEPGHEASPGGGLRHAGSVPTSGGDLGHLLAAAGDADDAASAAGSVAASAHGGGRQSRRPSGTGGVGMHPHPAAEGSSASLAVAEGGGAEEGQHSHAAGAGAAAVRASLGAAGRGAGGEGKVDAWFEPQQAAAAAAAGERRKGAGQQHGAALANGHGHGHAPAAPRTPPQGQQHGPTPPAQGRAAAQAAPRRGGVASGAAPAAAAPASRPVSSGNPRLRSAVGARVTEQPSAPELTGSLRRQRARSARNGNVGPDWIKYWQPVNNAGFGPLIIGEGTAEEAAAAVAAEREEEQVQQTAAAGAGGPAGAFDEAAPGAA